MDFTTPQLIPTRPTLGELRPGQPADDGRPRVAAGVCHALLAFDIGLSVDLNDAERRLTALTQRETIAHRRRAPQYFEFKPAPLRITAAADPISLGRYATHSTLDLVLYDFGAASVAFAIPIAGPLSDLLALANDLSDNPRLLAAARGFVEQTLRAIAPAVSKPCIAPFVEDYAIYQIERLEPAVDPARLIAEHGGILSQILRAESEPLSRPEVDEALSCRMSFRPDDMSILDWNAALLFDRDATDIRAVLEYSNVELLEMRYLDDQLDRALDEASAAFAKQSWRRLTSRAADLRKVAELQMDAAMLFEGVNNALKLLSDQYLARLYRLASQRLHLADWDASILRKLSTLESIYAKIADQQSARRMELLEWIIIILIAVSIGLPFIPGLPGH